MTLSKFGSALLVLVFALLAVVTVPTTAAQALSCSASVTAPQFGSPDILSGSALDAIGSMAITCTGGSTSQVLACPNMSAGTGNLGAIGPLRWLAQGTTKLSYNLYTDAYTTIWSGTADMGGGIAPSILVTLDGNGNGTTSGIPIYARIASGQTTLPVGLYQSLISVDVRSSATTQFDCTTVTTNSTVSTFTMSANYIANCVMATSNLSFGTIGATTSAVDAEAPLSLTCSSGSAYTLALDGGLSAASDPTQRRMSKSGNSVVYGLYRDASRQLPWGSDVTTMRNGSGTGVAQSLTVYGRIPAQATPPPGTYQDTIVATVSY